MLVLPSSSDALLRPSWLRASGARYKQYTATNQDRTKEKPICLRRNTRRREKFRSGRSRRLSNSRSRRRSKSRSRRRSKSRSRRRRNSRSRRRSNSRSRRRSNSRSRRRSNSRSRRRVWSVSGTVHRQLYPDGTNEKILRI